MHFTEAATSICSLKKVLTTCGQTNPWVFTMIWLLTINNFIIAQLLPKYWFLKNTSTRMLLTPKFFSEFDCMFCYHKVRILQKGFSHLLFAWSVKRWISLKWWNNHSRDWITNFPSNSRLQLGLAINNIIQKYTRIFKFRLRFYV